MDFRYPHKSKLREQLAERKEGRDYFVWQDKLQKRVESASSPIVEIGGPSDLGYYFLDDLRLPSEPAITNLSGLAEESVDGREMPYGDESVGIFLMSHMSLSSDWWVDLDDETKQKAAPKFNSENDIARLEMGQVAIGTLKPDDVRHAQRVQIYQEMLRALRGGGLFFGDGTIEDIIILQKLGFELAAFVQYLGPDASMASYEFVVSK